MEQFLQINFLSKLFCSAFLAILFLQSGLDKVLDWKGNLSWLKEHFGKTILKNAVPLLLGIITITEVAAGAFSAVGFLHLLFERKSIFAYYGAVLAVANIVMLFFGQRIAKDYVGAAGLVPYFIACMIAMWILG